MNMLLAVAAGGALGAVGRYLVMSQVGHWFGHGFPYGTLVVNIIGSLVMGLLVEAWALVWSPAPELRALLAVGLLGAFTTFSTFSLDVVVLYQRDAFLAVGLYILGSVIFSVAGLVAGLHIGRAIFS